MWYEIIEIINFLENPINILDIASTAIIGISLYLAYLKRGKLVFLRPTEISFTSTIQNAYKNGLEINKDLIGIPIIAVNTGARARTFQVSLIIKCNENMYSVLTNDYEIEAMPSNFILSKRLKENSGKNLRFQDIVNLNYASGFTINPRDKILKFVFFQSATDENRNPITFKGKSNIEIFLLYREKIPQYNKIKKIKPKENKHFMSKYKLKKLNWKCGFRIIWQTPNENNIETIRKGGIFSVTRFGFEMYKRHLFKQNFKCIKKAPCDLIKEDK